MKHLVSLGFHQNSVKLKKITIFMLQQGPSQSVIVRI